METKKIFNKENRLYKYYINNAAQDQASVDFIKSILKLEIISLDKTEMQDLVQLFEIVGFDKFFELASFFGGRSIKFPKIDALKNLLVMAIAYYQTEILGLSAKDAGKILSENLGLLNLKQKNVKALVSKLQQDIEYLTNKTLKKVVIDQQSNAKETV